MGIMDFFKKAEGKSKKDGSGGRGIDESAYQVNFDSFNDKKCPSCQFQLKQIVRKSNCPSCKKVLLNERHFSSKKQMLLTKEQSEKMAIEKKHYQDIKWAVQLGEELGLSRREISAMAKSTQVNTKFSVLWVRANDQSMKYAQKGKWLSYRNTRLSMGEIMLRDGHLQKALEFFLAVCYLDLNGPEDTGGFDRQRGGLKTGLLTSTQKLAGELRLDDNSLKEQFLSCARLEKNSLLPLSPEDAWEIFYKEYKM